MYRHKHTQTALQYHISHTYILLYIYTHILQMHILDIINIQLYIINKLYIINIQYMCYFILLYNSNTIINTHTNLHCRCHIEV